MSAAGECQPVKNRAAQGCREFRNFEPELPASTDGKRV